MHAAHGLTLFFLHTSGKSAQPANSRCAMEAVKCRVSRQHVRNTPRGQHNEDNPLEHMVL